MVNLKINIGLNLKETENPSKMLDQEVVFGWMRYAMEQKYPKGLHGSLLRTWGRIERKFVKAIDEKIDSIDLEEGEIEMVKKLFSGSEEINFPIKASRIIMQIEDAVNEALPIQE